MIESLFLLLSTNINKQLENFGAIYNSFYQVQEKHDHGSFVYSGLDPNGTLQSQPRGTENRMPVLLFSLFLAYVSG